MGSGLFAEKAPGEAAFLQTKKSRAPFGTQLKRMLVIKRKVQTNALVFPVHGTECNIVIQIIKIVVTVEPFASGRRS